ncbi:vomeronasal type-1 receptor 4-like [Erethizon dorsatum]
MGIFSLSQTGVGILANSSLPFHYVFSAFRGKTLTPRDRIIQHLILANSLTIISNGIPPAMVQFGLKYFLDDIGCKLIVYLYRVSQGSSLNTTCLLSCFQALTVSPSNTRWMKLKHRATKYISPPCSLSWFVHPLLNFMVTMRVTGPSNSGNVSKTLKFGPCAGYVSGTFITLLYVFLLRCTDGLCLGLMAWASASMVRTLYRHKRQVQYIHSAHCSPRVSPEARATQTILILVCTFVTFYALSSILILYSAIFGSGTAFGYQYVEFQLRDTCGLSNHEGPQSQVSENSTRNPGQQDNSDTNVWCSTPALALETLQSVSSPWNIFLLYASRPPVMCAHTASPPPSAPLHTSVINSLLLFCVFPQHSSPHNLLYSVYQHIGCSHNLNEGSVWTCSVFIGS